MRQEEKKDLLPLLRSLDQGQRKALLKKLKGMIRRMRRKKIIKKGAEFYQNLNSLKRSTDS